MGNCKSTDEDDEENEYKKAGKKNFDSWLHGRLQKYFEDIEVLVLDPRMSQKEKKSLTEAAEEMVDNIFKEVDKIDRRFHVKKSGFIRFGDFYENTESICIDEIEMYAVIDNISGENVIEAENTTIDYFETVQVKLRDKYTPKWEDCMTESSENTNILSSEKLALRFYDYVTSAVGNLHNKSRDFVEKEYGTLEIMEDNGVSRRKGGICLKVGWNSTVFLSILITPVLKLNEINPYVLRQECLSEMVYEAAMKIGSVFMVPEAETKNTEHRFNNHFRLSFVHIERYIMTECVSASHRRVFRVLQFLVNGYKKKPTSENQIFKEEELKNLLITHDMTCGKESAIGECTLSIINTMEQFLEDDKNKSLFIPSIFVEHMNVLRRSLVDKSNKSMPANSFAMSKIKEHLVNDVGRTPAYGFSDVISKFVPVNQYILDADYHDVKSNEF